MFNYSKILNANQMKVATHFDGPALVIAGAGTGKTKAIVYRTSRLIDLGIPPENILLLTFTNKAANEMIERINDLLTTPGEANRITACTYHSFSAMILRIYGKEIDLKPNYTILDSPDSIEAIKFVKETIFKDILDFPKAKELLNMISKSKNNEIDLKDLIDDEYPKYKFISNKIELLAHEYSNYKKSRNLVDYDDLMISFIELLETKNDICRKLSNQYKYIMVDEYQDSNVLQFKIIKLLRQYDNKNIMVVGDDQQCLHEDTLINTIIGPKKVKEITLDDEIQISIGNSKFLYKKPDEIFKNNYNGDLIEIKTKLGKTLKATPEHVLFVNDSILDNNYFGYELFSGDYNCNIQSYQHKIICDSNELLDKLKFSNSDCCHETCLLIMDENETTRILKDDIQFIRKAKLLTNKSFKFLKMSEIKKGMNICIYDNNLLIEDEVISIKTIQYKGYVYDINISNYRNYYANDICVHNCIYGFRGADFKNIINFPTYFKGCKVITLDENYRSNQEILDIANSLIDSAKEKYEKDLKGRYYKNELPQLVSLATSDDESQFIVNKINEYILKGYSLKDIVILVRTARDSNKLEALLNKDKIEYQKFGGIKFLEKKYVKDIFAYLKLTCNIKDELSWFRIFQLYPNIGTVYAKKITEDLLNNDIEVLMDKKYTTKKYGKYLPEIYKLIKLLETKDLKEQISFLVDKYYFNLVETTTNLSTKKESTKKEIISENKENKLEAMVLNDIAKDYKSTNKFLTDLTLEAPTIASGDDLLTISTVHSSKGLEYKVGFIINCVQGIFPTIRDNDILNKSKIIEEERRIFYVAITRVMEDLYVTYPREIMNYNGRYEYTEFSQFLSENDNYKKYFKRIRR